MTPEIAKFVEEKKAITDQFKLECRDMTSEEFDAWFIDILKESISFGIKIGKEKTVNLMMKADAHQTGSIPCDCVECEEFGKIVDDVMFEDNNITIREA